MKLLLTSSGITNRKITQALRDISGTSFQKLNLAFIISAANSQEIGYEDKSWLVKDLANFCELGFKSFDIINLELCNKKQLSDRLKKTDVLVVGGGDTEYLISVVRKSGFDSVLAELINKIVYVGISAGSMLMSHELAVSSRELEKLYREKPGNKKISKGLGYVNFHIRPHYYSKHFPLVKKSVLQSITPQLDAPMYAISDGMAIQVIGEKIKLVGQGRYGLFVKNTSTP